MTNRRAWTLSVVPVTLTLTVSALAPTVGPALAVENTAAGVRLLGTESWIIGPSGTPIPSESYLDMMSERFLTPAAPLFAGQPVFTVDKANPLFTPEGLYPLTGVKQLELDPSVAQGVSILDSTITDQVAAGNNLVVLGYSQSATISSLEMRNLLALPVDQQPTADQLSFVLVGDPSNPDGGLLSRLDITSLPTVGAHLPQVTLPSLGITFSGATPADTPWDTAIYTQEYDGFADFPKYPLNVLADLNAFLGIMLVHGSYPTLTDARMATAIELPTSDDYTGHTSYYMIPTENLPLLDLLRGTSFGNAFADLLQPDLKTLVDLGYGNLDTPEDIANGLGGWDLGPANAATPFGVFPQVDFGDLMTALAKGAQSGWAAFTADLADPVSTGAHGAAIDATGAASSLTDVVNGLSATLSNAYSALLPTADIANALLTTLPAYDVELFGQYLAAGDLVDAFGMPAAFTTGLVTMAAGLEAEAVMGALGLIPTSLG